MSNSNDSESKGLSDLLGGLVLAAGFGAMIMAPFYIAYRYGLHVLAIVVASMATMYAVFSPEVRGIAQDIKATSYRPGSTLEALADFLLAMDKIGWWWIAGVFWAIATICVFAWYSRVPQER